MRANNIAICKRKFSQIIFWLQKKYSEQSIFVSFCSLKLFPFLKLFNPFSKIPTETQIRRLRAPKKIIAKVPVQIPKNTQQNVVKCRVGRPRLSKKRIGTWIYVVHNFVHKFITLISIAKPKD